ncbi:hypothetical protein M911_00955 [Ectothiorhodospira haloalkaliphila]|uniref:Uncharacterized protein n=1 Tax=Ectothiorhodospira haloalkaliphila TaxID=421628 RepID=W8KL81_9GAMM|nr:hypothetical protein M911_00955 [Ectothiorhodospira haloalkaliphila]
MIQAVESMEWVLIRALRASGFSRHSARRAQSVDARTRGSADDRSCGDMVPQTILQRRAGGWLMRLSSADW